MRMIWQYRLLAFHSRVPDKLNYSFSVSKLEMLFVKKLWWAAITRNTFPEFHTVIYTKAWFSYVGKIPIGLGFHCFPTVPDFADTSNICQRFVPNFPDYEFGGTWKARETSKLEHKCNSISVTWMHTSLCCVVLKTYMFLHSSMQGFRFWKNRSQLN